MASGHTITITQADQHVVVTLGGEKLAESDRPVLLDETGLPTRYYLPREDVRTELLRPTDTATHCPYKGDASYYDVIDPHTLQAVDDAVWQYRTPYPSVDEITEYVAFYPEKVQIEVEGPDR